MDVVQTFCLYIHSFSKACANEVNIFTSILRPPDPKKETFMVFERMREAGIGVENFARGYVNLGD